MSRTNPWQSYRRIAAQTATPGHLILMLYEGALRFLEQARLGFKEEDPLLLNQTVSNNIQRAQAIIQELNYSLDMERGGEFADKMRGLYNYFDRRLQESNLRKQADGLDEVTRRLTVLRDAWAGMLNGQGAVDLEATSPRPELVAMN
jgi:flagellar protein FliS